jgi:hypothetical protein
VSTETRILVAMALGAAVAIVIILTGTMPDIG